MCPYGKATVVHADYSINTLKLTDDEFCELSGGLHALTLSRVGGH